MTELSKQETAKRKERPSEGQRFPFIPLQKALERVRELYSLTNTHDVPMKAAVKHWGYGDKSSGGLQTVAALKAFGLIVDTGSNDTRKIKLSDIAVKIIKDPREISPDRDALIKHAALLPPIHQEIISKYNGLPPSDDAFKAYLLLDKGMKDDSAVAFSKEFNATMSFAKVTDSATIQDVDSGETDRTSGIEQEPKHPLYPKKNEILGGKLMHGERELTTGLLSKDAGFRLIVNGIVGVKEIERLIKKLELDKEILADTDDGSDLV